MVRLDDGARDLFREFANAHGVTVSALLEAIARRLPPPGTVSEHHSAVIEEARSIDVERRQRG